MKRYSANYANTNHNFVIQNLEGKECKNSIFYPSICIVKNILHRGKPTLTSSFLQKHIGSIHKDGDFKKHIHLISQKVSKWSRLIKGSSNSTYNPALDFYNKMDEILDDECTFLKNLVVPEVLISDITQEKIKEFENQHVDFYIPQAFLVIEIDGSQHNRQIDYDNARDEYLFSRGVKVVRIPTSDISTNNLKKYKNEIQEHLNSREYKKILSVYKSNFINGLDAKNKKFLKATSIMRYQILILELLKYGKLNLNDSLWNFELCSDDNNCHELFKLAILDLFIYFKRILTLQSIDFVEPNIKIRVLKNKEDFSGIDNIKIDFSIFKRYTDENQIFKSVIFVRTDYISSYKYFENTTSSSIKKYKIEEIDHYQVESCKLVNYKFNEENRKINEKILRELLWDLFLQADETLDAKTTTFRDGQIEIIKNVLTRQNTIGLLPTGSGKSICYQLSGLLQPAPSFIVAPILSLMKDQLDELDKFYFTRASSINSEQTTAQKYKTIEEFGNGKFFYLFISPERFQNIDFRVSFSKLNTIAYAVVDEAHCMSEWGHDFRTSYLTLVNTIKKYKPNVCLLGLSATASLSVLKDLKLAFNITNNKDVKTPLDYSREELEFYVIDSSLNKRNSLYNIINKSKDDFDKFSCIIFTPYASEKIDYGCAFLANDLKSHFEEEINFYSGKLDQTEKRQIQDGFKNNEFPILVSTKAFGMGVNKGNIKYTVHYGIPSSLESLYQEAGRAGRAKKLFKEQKAQCYILFSAEENQEALNQIWDINSKRDDLFRICDGNLLYNDLAKQLFLMKEQFISVDKEVLIIKNIYQNLKENLKNKNEIHCAKIVLEIKKILNEDLYIPDVVGFVEKYLFRLYQLGIINDWTIKYPNIIRTDFKRELTSTEIQKNCEKQIRKYDAKFSFNVINSDNDYIKYKNILKEDISEEDKYIKILLEWAFDKFVGYRRQSLKNIYEACQNYIDEKKIKDEKMVSKTFKNNIESYFKVNEAGHKLNYLVENQDNIAQCLELFYIYDDNQKTDNIVSGDELKDLSIMVRKMLQDYTNNVVLNLTSGLIKLLENNFENADGKQRLEHALSHISKSKEYNERKFIVEEIASIFKTASKEQKNDLSKILVKYFEEERFIVAINKRLNDEYTNTILLKRINNRLEKIVNNLLKI